MAKVIAMANKKGGVLKTTTAISLGAALRKRGKSILYIDMDDQCNLSRSCRADISGKSVLGVLLNQITAEEAVQHTEEGDIIPASHFLVGINGILTETGKEYRLAEALESIKEKYDFILIDTPPRLEVETSNALVAADEVIVPTQLDLYCLDGLIAVNSIVRQIKKYCNSSLKISGILLTRYSDRLKLNKELIKNFQELATKMETKIFATGIRECTKAKEAQVLRKNIFDYDARCNAAADYDKLADEILGE